MSFSGVVLDVVLSSAIEYLDVDSLIEITNVIPTAALAPASTVGLTDTTTDLPTDLLTSEDNLIEILRVASALTETPINDATSKTTLSLKQVVHLALKEVNESDSQVQLQEISANMAHTIKLQNASDAKQEEIKQLQNLALEHHMQALERQEKMDRLQNEMELLQIQNQEELRQMHTEAMGQLAVLQSRVQADVIMPTADHVIEWMYKITVDEGNAVEDVSVSKGNPAKGVAEQIKTKEALESADIRKINTLLQGKDGSKVLRNLYRTITVERHVNWVCIDHYREN
ncbi:hypothetical protein BGZ98_001404 [Dissophora globulifera]|nr:hypothetical protein BGZ98_001404 [Dissophora globulifera]